MKVTELLFTKANKGKKSSSKRFISHFNKMSIIRNSRPFFDPSFSQLSPTEELANTEK